MKPAIKAMLATKIKRRPNSANQPHYMKPQGNGPPRFLGWNFFNSPFPSLYNMNTESGNSDKRHSWKAIHLPIIHRPGIIHNSKSKWEELGTLKIRRTTNSTVWIAKSIIVAPVLFLAKLINEMLFGAMRNSKSPTPRTPTDTST